MIEQLKDNTLERHREVIVYVLATNSGIYEKLCELVEVMELERYDDTLSVRDEATLEHLSNLRDAAFHKRLSDAP